MMIPYLRQKMILDMLQENEIVYINDLKEAMSDVSESTIKRDLRTLAQESRVELLQGGAVKLLGEKGGLSFDMPMNRKEQLNKEGKEKIAEYAASLVNSGEVIFLDTSSTVAPMVKYLKDKEVTIVTTSIRLPVMVQSENLRFYLVGGDYNKLTESVLGSSTDELLSSMYFDKAFVGANGFSEAAGITTPDFRESTKKRIVLQNSKETYFLMDASKANVTTFSRVISLEECNLITDKELDLLRLCKSSKVVK